jgi:2-polyprenyl-3-methyl-5-hydroxy-6-metoxy-1,4-benzoquinol methylase
VRQPVLWPELIAQWRLSPEEAEIIDRREGIHCTTCQSNLRSMALARAVVSLFHGAGTLAETMTARGATLRILEVNEAGSLTPFLARAVGHRLVQYPEVDLHTLPFPDGSFDLVVHSDTLEHVERPVRALAECRRVLVPGGHCAFTVPLVVGRLTLSREGMPPSFHGNPNERDPAVMVRTEYGADAWRQVLEAGFSECRIVPYEPPGAIAFVARRGIDDHPLRTRTQPLVSEETVLQMKWFYEFRLPSGARTESVLPREVLPIHETRERILLGLLEARFGGRWAATECLDIACHEGYFGSLLAQRGCHRVLGIDARSENLTRAELMRDVLRLPNLEFRQVDLSSVDPTSLGRFDIVLMLGLLYHLEDPIGSLHRVRAMCREVAVIETQLAPALDGSIEWGTAGTHKEVVATFAVVDETDEVRSGNREANTRPLSLVPDLEGLVRVLGMVGFSRVEVLRPPEDSYEQFVRVRRAMVAAWV